MLYVLCKGGGVELVFFCSDAVIKYFSKLNVTYQSERGRGDNVFKAKKL